MAMGVDVEGVRVRGGAFGRCGLRARGARELWGLDGNEGLVLREI